MSPTSFQKEQSRIELGIVRTKLKQTENELKDASDTIEILSARNKLFEEKCLNDAYDKIASKTEEKTDSQKK